MHEKDYIDGKIDIHQYHLLCERDELESLFTSGLSVGMEYSEMLKMDNRIFYRVYKGKLKYIERSMNNQISLNRKFAVDIRNAFDNIRQFNKGIEPITLVEPDKAEKAASIANREHIKREVIRDNILR